MRFDFSKLSLAAISDSFRSLLESLRGTETIIFQTPGDKKFLKVIRKGTDESNYYYFSERNGRDSIAFILFDSNTGFYTLLKQFSTSTHSWVIGAFTGSLDKPNSSVLDILIDEVREEAGYIIDSSDAQYLGLVPVGSQTNEQVHLYIIDVSDLIQGDIEPENLWEENTEFIEATVDDILLGDDWRAALIVERHLAQITIRSFDV